MPRQTPAVDTPSTEVFAVFGVEPEIQAYAMAKYSRSALSMKESLRRSARRRQSNSLTLSIFSMDIGRSPIWHMWRWR